MSQRHQNEPRDRSSDTRLRLLEAAGEAFADLGFRDATVRDICKRASANVAAVNYHFGDKERLYSATLDHWVRASYQRFPPNMGVEPGDQPQARLHASVRSLLFRTLGDGRQNCHGRLLLREFLDPTPALEAQIKAALGPMFQQLEQTIDELSDHLLDPAQRRLAVLSIIGQCVFHHQTRPLINQIYPTQTYATEDIEHIADHITAFSIAGIRNMTHQHTAKAAAT